jgi:hypothetical protein
MSFKSLLDKVTSFSPHENEAQITATQSHISRIGKSYSKSFMNPCDLEELPLEEKNRISFENCNDD